MPHDVLAAMLGIVWVLRLIEVHRMDVATRPSGVLSAERLKETLWRPTAVLFCVLNLIEEIAFPLSVGEWLFNHGWLLYTLAVYFVACRNLPPKPRRSRVPANAVASPAP
jgi:hypothetical protein